MGYRKPFDEATYKRVDGIAKKIAKLYLESRGHIVQIEPEACGIDLIVGNPKIYGIELEVKESWRTYDYIFPDVHILERKKNHLEDDRNYYWIFNAMYNRFMLVNVREVKKYPLKSTPNRNCPDGSELMRWVLLNDIEFRDMDAEFVEPVMRGAGRWEQYSKYFNKGK